MNSYDSVHSAETIIVYVDRELEPLLCEYYRTCINDIKKLGEALEQQDFEVIDFIAHKMKGGGELYGFSKITEIGKSLQNSARNQRSDEIRIRIEDLRQYLDRVKVQYVDQIQPEQEIREPTRDSNQCSD